MPFVLFCVALYLQNKDTFIVFLFTLGPIQGWAKVVLQLILILFLTIVLFFLSFPIKTTVNLVLPIPYYHFKH